VGRGRTRRWVLTAAAAALAAACRRAGEGGVAPEAVRHDRGRLGARPGAAAGEAAPGDHPLPLPEGEALLHVPPGGDGAPAPLLVALHGAGGRARGALAAVATLADRHRFLVVAVSSRGSTWDLLRGGTGPDVATLDAALAAAFARHPVDPARLAIQGFSDGASYALSLGQANGDLFGAVLAFSPGFTAPPVTTGRPRVFVSHGTADPVLPIDRCSRRIVPALRTAGYEVAYREFDGGHVVPADVAEAAVAWWLPAPRSPGDA